MNNFETDDLIGRKKFKQDFRKHYIMQDTQEYDHTDIMLTACTTGCIYNTEIKNRSYSIDEIGNSSYLEKTKLDYFREQYRHDSSICYVYFNYYSDGGWIAFDMSNRIKYGLGLDKQSQMLLPATSSYDNGSKMKDVISLSYTNSIYVQDKMYCK